MIRIKICGNTSVEDALAAVRAGADAIGLIFYKESPRNIDPVEAARICAALPPFVSSVGVFVNEKPENVKALQRRVGFDYVQLHGDEPPEQLAEYGPRTLKALRPGSEAELTKLDTWSAAGAILLDTPKAGVYGGSGKTGDWALAAQAAARLAKRGQPLLLAGGLTPDNVSEAITRVNPFGVDIVSGVEAKPGKKDEQAMHRFVAQALKTALR